MLDNTRNRLDARRDASGSRALRFVLALVLVVLDAAPLLAERFSPRTETSSLRTATRAQGTNLTGLMLGILVSALIAIEVFIPTVTEAINDSNASGSTLVILGLLPLFAALLVLISLASPLIRRV